jgi:hypothetical protein
VKLLKFSEEIHVQITQRSYQLRLRLPAVETYMLKKKKKIEKELCMPARTGGGFTDSNALL